MILTSNQRIDPLLLAQVNYESVVGGQLPVKFTLLSFIINSLMQISVHEIDISSFLQL